MVSVSGGKKNCIPNVLFIYALFHDTFNNCYYINVG
jgi:hypothetical protein